MKKRLARGRGAPVRYHKRITAASRRLSRDFPPSHKRARLSYMPPYEIVGSREGAVAIMELPKIGRRLARDRKAVARYDNAKAAARRVMLANKNVKAVLLKVSARRGELRLRKYKLVLGRKAEVVHKENKCRFKLDPRRVYFSPREATERMRIAQMVKPNENVMVFFAGVGPYCIVIAKHARPKKVVGIELNADAARYFEENIKLNKLKNVIALQGDVRNIAKRELPLSHKRGRLSYFRKCNRVIMPLPESAFQYLDEAIKCCKKGGIIHLYFISKEDELSAWKRKLGVLLRAKRAVILNVQRVLPYGPRIWKMRADIKVENKIK